jgi:AcrR family transcriptional regulator
LGTLYRNFPFKAELMVEVVAEVAQREVDAVAKIAIEAGTAAERLSASAWLFASRALLGRKLAHALVAEAVEPEIESARLKCRRKAQGLSVVSLKSPRRPSDPLIANQRNKPQRTERIPPLPRFE